MDPLPRFYRDDEQLDDLLQSLKWTPCPHCHRVGTLIRHGFLHGVDENSPHQPTLRGRRILCNRRRQQPGCGKTFTLWLADKIQRLKLTTTGLWRFLQQVVAQGILAASCNFACHLSERTLFRVWKRFRHAQSQLRTALCNHHPRPQPTTLHRPEAETLAHLRAVFPDAPCPIAAFQLAMQTFAV